MLKSTCFSWFYLMGSAQGHFFNHCSQPNQFSANVLWNFCLSHSSKRPFLVSCKLVKTAMQVFSSLCKWGVWAKTSKLKNNNFLIYDLRALKKLFYNLRLNKLLMCFEINGLKCLKLTILRFLPRPPAYTYYSNSSKTFLLLEHYLLSINSHKFTYFLYLCFEIYFLRKQLF